MQTTGAALLAVKRCSPARVLMAAQDSRSTHGLLHLAAVRTGSHEQEHRQTRLDGAASVHLLIRMVGSMYPGLTRGITAITMSELD